MRAIVIAALLALALGGQVAAQPGPKKDKHPTAPVPSATERAAEEVVGIVFSEVERRLIRDYLAQKDGNDGDRGKKAKAKGKNKGKSKSMPPGLAKRDALPPGLAQQLRRHGTLPPGLAKRDLPSDLESRLPKLRRGLSRHIVGADVVLIEEATGVILDILEGVVRNQ